MTKNDWSFTKYFVDLCSHMIPTSFVPRQICHFVHKVPLFTWPWTFATFVSFSHPPFNQPCSAANTISQSRLGGPSGKALSSLLLSARPSRHSRDRHHHHYHCVNSIRRFQLYTPQFISSRWSLYTLYFLILIYFILSHSLSFTRQ